MTNEEAIKEIEKWLDGCPFEDTKEAFKRAIKALEERPQGEWIDYSEDGFVECPFCHKATTCEDNIDELHYCWNCGAQMSGGEDHD